MSAKKKAPAVTLGKTEGPDGERSAPILLDGVEIGTLETLKQINFRPAKHLDFSHVYVMLWAPDDYEGTFDADTYGDANTARRAALDAVRAYLAARPVKAPVPVPVAPTAPAPAFRSITHGEIVRLPVGTRVDTENGLHRISLGGEWFILLSPAGGSGRRTREVIGKVRVTPPDARALWALLMDHAYARITLAGGVEVDVDVPTELRALLDAEIQAQDPSAFARRVLATARARTTVNTRLPAIREDAPQLYDGPGFIRVTFAPLTPSVPLRHLTTPTKDTPLSIEEQRKLARANGVALDIMDDGGKLPADVDRLLNSTGRKLTPAEARRMIAWLDTVE